MHFETWAPCPGSFARNHYVSQWLRWIRNSQLTVNTWYCIFSISQTSISYRIISVKTSFSASSQIRCVLVWSDCLIFLLTEDTRNIFVRQEAEGANNLAVQSLAIIVLDIFVWKNPRLCSGTYNPKTFCFCNIKSQGYHLPRLTLLSTWPALTTLEI